MIGILDLNLMEYYKIKYGKALGDILDLNQQTYYMNSLINFKYIETGE